MSEPGLPLPPELVEQIRSDWQRNPMRRPRIAKVVVNIGLGGATERLQKAAKLLEELTGQKPVLTRAKKTIKDFGIRKGEPIGVKVTLRKERAIEFLKKVLEAVNYKIPAKSFDEYGNVGIGIQEHIQLPGTKYDPEVGIFGMDVVIAIERPGYRITRRRRCRKKHIPARHRVKKEESMVYLHDVFGVQIV